jgi:hypothetical protein
MLYVVLTALAVYLLLSLLLLLGLGRAARKLPPNPSAEESDKAAAPPEQVSYVLSTAVVSKPHHADSAAPVVADRGVIPQTAHVEKVSD